MEEKVDIKTENPPKDQGKISPPGSKTPSSLGSPLSDDTCPICLGTITDKCAANTCAHSFCLVCLKEWSKHKAVCPLCKQPFTKIWYDIKSETQYKEYRVPPPDPIVTAPESFDAFLRVDSRTFFGYRTTNYRLPDGRRPRRRSQILSLLSAYPDSLPTYPRWNRRETYNLRTSATFRRSIYTENVWVEPISDINGRYRETGPELYREQQALTHRLVPWVNRELAALLPASRVGVVLVEVMELIERYSINSQEFRRALRPHFGRHTNHFVHEFFHFARSPYDMLGHDDASVYCPRYGNDDDEDSDSNSDDDVIIVDSTSPPIQQTSTAVDVSSADNVAREEIVTGGTAYVTSDESSSQGILNYLVADRPLNPLEQAVQVLEETHNPEPPSYNVLTLSLPCTSGHMHDYDQPGPSGISVSNSGVVHKREHNSNDSDSDDCLIVDEVKPQNQRPHVVIDLSSGEESKDRGAVDELKKKKKDATKQKPKLDRHSFSEHLKQQQLQVHDSRDDQDHTYCSGNADIDGINRTDGNEARNTSSLFSGINLSDSENASEQLEMNAVRNRRCHWRYSSEEHLLEVTDAGDALRSSRKDHRHRVREVKGKQTDHNSNSVRKDKGQCHREALASACEHERPGHSRDSSLSNSSAFLSDSTWQPLRNEEEEEEEEEEEYIAGYYQCKRHHHLGRRRPCRRISSGSGTNSSSSEERHRRKRKSEASVRHKRRSSKDKKKKKKKKKSRKGDKVRGKGDKKRKKKRHHQTSDSSSSSSSDSSDSNSS